MKNHDGILVRSLIVILTLAVVGASIFGILTTMGKKQQLHHRKALAVCEFGLMKALQKVNAGVFEFKDIPKTECDDGWYSISFKKYEKNDTIFLQIIARGFVGSGSEERKCILRLERYDTNPVWVQHHQ